MTACQTTRLDDPSCTRALRHTGVLSRCSDIVQSFRPGLISTERVDGDSLLVELALEDGSLLSKNDRERLARSLALQLGFRVILSNYNSSSEQAPIPRVGAPTTDSSSGSTEALLPVVIDPTVYTVLHTGQFSNIYETVPPDILARIHSQRVIQGNEPHTAPHEPPAIIRVKSVLEHFSVTMHEAKVHSFDGFLHVILDATPDIVEEELFYELTKELHTASGGKSLVVTVAPNKIVSVEMLTLPPPPATDVEVEQVARDDQPVETPELAPSPMTNAFCARLREEIGTLHPYTITRDHATGHHTVQLLHKKTVPESYEHLAAQIKELGDTLGFPVNVTLKHSPRNDLILSQGKRDTVSDDEMLGMAALLRANLLCSSGSEWATITPEASSSARHGNCLEITPNIHLTAPLVAAIKAAAYHIPAPIVIHRDGSTHEPLSLGAVKSLVKLLLPPSASLDSIRAASSGEVAVTISTSTANWPQLRKKLAAAIRSRESDHQKITFKFKERDGKVCDALAQRSDIHRKFFISNMNQEGIISIADWNTRSNKAVKLAGASRHELHKRYPTIIDRTDLRVTLWDVHGTARAEDGQSLTIKDGVLTHGIHFANAAIQIDQFSPERHKAYRRGDSLYVLHDGLGIVSHMFPGLMRHTFQDGIVTPALSVFIDYKLEELSDPESVARSISDARIEPTFVRPSAAYLYPRNPSASWSKELPKAARRELRLMSQLGAALTRYSAGPDVRIAADSPDPGHHIRNMIYLANHICAKALQGSKLPCLYQATQPPSPYVLKTLLREIDSNRAALPELEPFSALDPETLINDPALLHRLYSTSRSLPQERRELIRFPNLHKTYSITPDIHVLSGYNPLVPVNTGFRKLASLVAQHQLNAWLGLVTPLSPGEVSALEAHYLRQQESGHADKIERDLRLLGLFRYLKQRQSDPMFVRVRGAPRNGTAPVDVHLPFGVSLPCFVALRPTHETSLHVGDRLRVIPVNYSLGDNTLLFRIQD